MLKTVIEEVIKGCDERESKDISENIKILKKIMRAVVLVYPPENQFDPLLDWLIDASVLSGKCSKVEEVLA